MIRQLKQTVRDTPLFYLFFGCKILFDISKEKVYNHLIDVYSYSIGIKNEIFLKCQRTLFPFQTTANIHPKR